MDEKMGEICGFFVQNYYQYIFKRIYSVITLNYIYRLFSFSSIL